MRFSAGTIIGPFMRPAGVSSGYCHCDCSYAATKLIGRRNDVGAVLPPNKKLNPNPAQINSTTRVARTIVILDEKSTFRIS